MPRSVNRLPKPDPAPGGLPQFCDFGCPHAGFAPADASGACRREQAVYCSLFRTFNNKHNGCLDRQPGNPRRKKP